VPWRVIAALARIWALFGGCVLLAIMLMTVASVALRATTGRPILGDFELVEMGTAIAAFAFLPYCQQTGGNVLVDFFTQGAPERLKSGLAALASLLLLLLALLLLWRMSLGGLDFHRFREETTNLGIPRWWAFPPILISLALLALASLATLVEDVAALRRGRRPAA
jgi:TRAP-type C4-dicarboxylate transport system permease small subunit